MTIEVQARKQESMLARFQYCFRMLHLHGLMTDAELEKVKKRLIRKWNSAATKEPK